MDSQSVPITGKPKPLTFKTNHKFTRPKKNLAGTPPTHVHRPKRVFGSNRSTNFLLKREPNKPLSKSSSLRNGINQQCQPKYSMKLSSSKPIDKQDPAPLDPTVAAEENKCDEIKPKIKKNVSFQDPLVGNLAQIVQEEGSGPSSAFNSPVLPPSSSPSNEHRVIPRTPYYSAENCGKCRLDRLDSSSYWVEQIKLAESVGKHFLSAAFFLLAAESNAELVPSLRIELRSYLSRHGSSCTDTKWKDVSIRYGLLSMDTHVLNSDLGGSDGGAASVDKEQRKMTHEAISRQVLLAE